MCACQCENDFLFWFFFLIVLSFCFFFSSFSPPVQKQSVLSELIKAVGFVEDSDQPNLVCLFNLFSNSFDFNSVCGYF